VSYCSYGFSGAYQGYHQVVNAGCNLAEAINFIPASCLEFALAAKKVCIHIAIWFPNGLENPVVLK
jgi:hypothetical protein